MGAGPLKRPKIENAAFDNGLKIWQFLLFRNLLRYSFFSQESRSQNDLRGTIFHCKNNEKTVQAVKNRRFFGGKCGRILRSFVGS